MHISENINTRIADEYTLCHMEEHKYFEDSIGMVSNWKRRCPIYEVPFGTLYNGVVLHKRDII